MKNNQVLVAIGASAGGLEAIQEFFDHMPSDSGLSFVIIQHLSPDFKSMMDELLSRYTKMTIHVAQHAMQIEPNTVYLIPPKKNMELSEDNRLLLTEQDRTNIPNLPINQFFTSMAKAKKENSVAVVLSGTGSDGSKGILDVSEAGGLVLAQSIETAKFDGMPKSAIITKTVNKALAPSDMPDFILGYTDHPHGILNSQASLGDNEQFSGEYKRIFRAVFDKHGINLEDYKPGTIHRRLLRRMKTLRLSTQEEYLKIIENDPEEIDALTNDTIIGVTSFFRDEEAFDVLRHNVIPKLFSAKHDEIRIWVCACSNGSEAYSVAMLCEEHIQQNDLHKTFKIFATDVMPASISFASQGLYPEEIIDQILERDLVEKYFLKTPKGYQIGQNIRNKVVFTVQNVIMDPPFTRMDLVTCRNLLIYFKPDIQRDVLANFHFGLKKDGILFLGSSEHLGSLQEEFDIINPKWKVFTKKRDIRLPPRAIQRAFDRGVPSSNVSPEINLGLNTRGSSRTNLATFEYDSLIKELVPNGIIINNKNEVTHVFGKARQLIKTPEGNFRSVVDVFQLVQKNFKVPLSTALIRVKNEKETVVIHKITLQDEDGPQDFKVTVKALNNHDKKSSNVLILLEDQKASTETKVVNELKIDIDQQTEIIIGDLEKELQHTKESLQATIEEVETTNEELQSTNEELLASNEELQSTNEELQSVNEELYTLNSEHQQKISELTRLNNDIDNLLSSQQVATIFIDDSYKIRKFTPQVGTLFHLIEGDVGRSILHFTSEMNYSNLEKDIQVVIQNGSTSNKKILSRSGRSYLSKISPYKVGNSVKGAVLSFIDIEDQVELEERLLKAEKMTKLGNWTWSIEPARVEWSPELRNIFGLKLSDAVPNIEDHQKYILKEDWPTFKKTLDNAINTAKPYKVSFRIRVGNQIKYIKGEGSPQFDHDGKLAGFFGVAQDVTVAQQQQERYELVVKGSSVGIWDWVDVNKDTEVWSDKFYDLLGYETGEIEASITNFEKMLHPDDRAATFKMVEDHFKGTSVFDIDYRLKTKSGDYKWFRGTGHVLRDDEGNPTRMAGSIADIHDKKTAEQSLKNDQSRMIHTARMASVGEMAAGIAHEINNPLTILKGRVQSLYHMQKVDSKSVVEVAEKIDSTIDRISSIITGLRKFSRNEENEDVQKTTLNNILKETYEFCSQRLAGENIKLTQTIETTDSAIMCRPIQTSQVLLNLIQNARDEVKNDSSPWIDIKVWSDSKSLSIAVTDSGKGISEDIVYKVFEPFFTTKGIGLGTGLGLSLSKQIMEAQGGRLLYDNKSKNTRFVMQFPKQ